MQWCYKIECDFTLCYSLYFTIYNTMVRNISGGTGTKSLARKLTTNHSSVVPLPSNDLEKIAVVAKLIL